MAESAALRDPLQRYSEIEQAYRDDRWQEVIRSGADLLNEFGASPDAAMPGLKERVELLMAHAYLYGLGDRDNAEDLYNSVLRSGSEPELRQIATQGVQQCNLPIASSSQGSDDPGEEASDVGAAGSPGSTDGQSTAPGVQAAAEPGGPGSAAAVEAESDSRPAGLGDGQATGLSGSDVASVAIEPVAPVELEPSAEPRVTREPLREPSAHDTTSSSEPALPWLGGASGSQAGGAATSLPVMPWLQETPPATGAATAVIQAQQPESPLSAEPAAAVGTGADSGTVVSTPAAIIPRAGATETGGASAATGQTGDGPLSSWLSQSADAAPVSAAAVAAATPALQAASTPDQQPLIPEVVDEPELIELHQADPLRAEELDLSIRESLPGAGFSGPGPSADLGNAATPADPGLPIGGEGSPAAWEPIPVRVEVLDQAPSTQPVREDDAGSDLPAAASEPIRLEKRGREAGMGPGLNGLSAAEGPSAEARLTDGMRERPGAEEPPRHWEKRGQAISVAPEPDALALADEVSLAEELDEELAEETPATDGMEPPEARVEALTTLTPPRPGRRSAQRRQRQPGPFRLPPQQVAREDPELLLGLLRVEMG